MATLEIKRYNQSKNMLSFYNVLVMLHIISRYIYNFETAWNDIKKLKNEEGNDDKFYMEHCRRVKAVKGGNLKGANMWMSFSYVDSLITVKSVK